jgi:hypothetical protein
MAVTIHRVLDHAGHVDSATVSSPRTTVKNRVSLAHQVYRVLPPTRKR